MSRCEEKIREEVAKYRIAVKAEDKAFDEYRKVLNHYTDMVLSGKREEVDAERQELDRVRENYDEAKRERDSHESSLLGLVLAEFS